MTFPWPSSPVLFCSWLPKGIHHQEFDVYLFHFHSSQKLDMVSRERGGAMSFMFGVFFYTDGTITCILFCNLLFSFNVVFEIQSHRSSSVHLTALWYLTVWLFCFINPFTSVWTSGSVLIFCHWIYSIAVNILKLVSLGTCASFWRAKSCKWNCWVTGSVPFSIFLDTVDWQRQ